MHVVSLERVQDCSKLPDQQFNDMQNTIDLLVNLVSVKCSHSLSDFH